MSTSTRNSEELTQKEKIMKKTITIILIIIWMITVFIFSNQPSDESSNLSEGFTTTVLKLLHIHPENQDLVDKIETAIRKLAHYFIYLIGGILIYTHINLYNIKTGNKIAISQIIRFCICNIR